MGYEYRLRVTAPDPEAVDAVLRRLPGARPAAPGPGFDFGDVGSGWPEASAQADPDGVYFVHYGGAAGRALLGEVTVALVDVFGAVSVEEM